MTKAKLARLIELSKSTAILRPYREYEELAALQAEFAAWEPDEQPVEKPYRPGSDWSALREWELELKQKRDG